MKKKTRVSDTNRIEEALVIDANQLAIPQRGAFWIGCTRSTRLLFGEVISSVLPSEPEFRSKPNKINASPSSLAIVIRNTYHHHFERIETLRSFSKILELYLGESVKPND